MKFFKLFFIFFTILISLQYSPAFSKAQNNDTTKPSFKKNDEPTTIKSKSINVKRKSGIVEFDQDAVIENGDTSILSDKMIVFYDENKDDKTSNINKIEAINNVKVFNEEFIVTGDNGSYDPHEETLIITNNVVFNNGTSIANGEKFTYNLKTNKGFLVGKKADIKNLKSDRVIVIINENNDK